MKELRAYQREAVDAFLKSDGHAFLKLWTGSGKTLIAINIVRELRARHGDLKVLFMTPTIDLKDQTRDAFAAEGVPIPEIVTYAWAARYVDEVEVRNYDCLIFDEGHHLGEAPVFGRLLVPAFKARYALGLSATPPEDPENYALRVMPVVYTRTYQEGLAEGYAAPVKIIPIGVELTEQERKRYQELTGIIREMIARYGENYQNRPYRKDPVTGETIWGATITNERRHLISLAHNKYEELSHLATKLLHLDSCAPLDDDVPTRLFVWTDFVAALEKAKELLNRNGPVAELVTGKTPKKLRHDIITQQWGRDFPILLTAKVGNEGLDAPEASVGVILAGSKTTREQIQRVGRLLRPLPNKVATLYVIYALGTTDTKILDLLREITQ